MRVAPAIPLSLVVDTVQVLTAEDYTALSAQGFKARGGYVDLVKPEELAACLASGMAFSPIGFAHETQLVEKVRALGIPNGATVYQDVEDETGPAEALIARINACAASLQGYQPGGYFGALELLTSAELSNLAVTTYWKGCSRVLDRFGNVAEPARGYAMLQLRPYNTTINGKTFDVSAVTQDYKDALPMWVWA